MVFLSFTLALKHILVFSIILYFFHHKNILSTITFFQATRCPQTLRSAMYSSQLPWGLDTHWLLQVFTFGLVAGMVVTQGPSASYLPVGTSLKALGPATLSGGHRYVYCRMYVMIFYFFSWVLSYYGGGDGVMILCVGSQYMCFCQLLVVCFIYVVIFFL